MAKKRNNTSAYLQQLKFDPSLSKSFIAKYLTNVRLVALLVIAIIVTGLVSFYSTPRRLNPELKIPLVSVTTVLPGAGPEDVEKLVTVPLEDELEGVDKVSVITSTSQENVSSIFVEFESTVDPDKAKEDAQNAIDQVLDLPEDAEDPRVLKLDFEDQAVLTFAMTSNSDTASLMRFSENLRDVLEDDSKIDRVVMSGLEERELNIQVDQEKLQEYGLDTSSLQRQVASAVNAAPAGTVQTSEFSFPLSLDATATSLEDIRNLRIDTGEGFVRLSEIAQVSERSAPDQFTSYIATNDMVTDIEQAVTFNVFKGSSADIDVAVENAFAIIDEEQSRYGDQFERFIILDTSKLVTEQIDELVVNFASTIALVFLTLFIFLGIRQAIITSFSIPLTFLVSFTVMNISGITVNFLSLFSLLLGLGLLVDDAIVIITAMTTYHRSGKFTPTQTGLLVWRDYLTPIWSTTITTVWAFVPLLLATGIIGEFIKSIPIIVSTTLISSTAIAVLVTLPLMIVILKPSIPRRVKMLFKSLIFIGFLSLIVMIFRTSSLLPLIIVGFILLIAITYRVRGQLADRVTQSVTRNKSATFCASCIISWLDHGLVDFTKISAAYKKRIKKILENKSSRRKTITVVVVFSIASYLLVPLGFVVNEFFPGSDNEQIYVGYELPSGTRADVAEESALPVMEILRNTEDIKYVTQETAQVPPDVGTVGVGPNNILFTIALPKEDKRDRSSLEIAQELREKTSSITSGKVSIIEVSGGPPAGADIQIKLLGDDLSVLDQKASEVVEYLEAVDGVDNVAKSITPGTSKIVFVPDLDNLARYGVSESQIGLTLRTFTSGFTLVSVDFSGEEKDIVFRTNDETPFPERISSVTIPTQQGDIPLTELGRLELAPNPTQITREDGDRTISVTASVNPEFSISILNQDLETYANTDLSLPDGYSWKTGGVNEENQNSVNSILQAMLLSAILILATVVIQLGSYRKALIIVLVIPLAISGVFVMFALTGTPLSFPALIGILALFGIVVNNSIIMVEKINQNRNVGMDLVQSVYDAASSRVEPIFFSSLTTIIGLIPITLSDPLWRGLGGAIISGLAFSGTIMLFFIPVVYYMWFMGEKQRV